MHHGFLFLFLLFPFFLREFTGSIDQPRSPLALTIHHFIRSTSMCCKGMRWPIGSTDPICPSHPTFPSLREKEPLHDIFDCTTQIFVGVQCHMQRAFDGSPSKAIARCILCVQLQRQAWMTRHFFSVHAGVFVFLSLSILRKPLNYFRSDSNHSQGASGNSIRTAPPPPVGGVAGKPTAQPPPIAPKPGTIRQPDGAKSSISLKPAINKSPPAKTPGRPPAPASVEHAGERGGATLDHTYTGKKTKWCIFIQCTYSPQEHEGPNIAPPHNVPARTLHTAHCTLHTAHCTAHCTPHTPHCIRHTCKLYGSVM